MQAMSGCGINSAMKFDFASTVTRLRRACSQNRELCSVYKCFPFLHRARHKTMHGTRDINEAELIHVNWPTDTPKPVIGICHDNYSPRSWIKYQRFCETNDIPFGEINIHGHDWMDQVKAYDWVVGHPSGSPSRLDELWRKTYVMEKWLGKLCYPSTKDLALYEDKHMQYDTLRALGFPLIPTWISYDREDALRLASTLEYPLVSKLITGAGSRGVELLRNSSDAKSVIQKVFSERGRYWHWPYLRQKDYVLFQKFIPNNGYDIRVICSGNMAFGYYRKAAKGDFRASGSGICEKRALPECIIRIAHSIALKVQAPYLSVDFLQSMTGEYFIIEMAHFNQIDTAEQLHVDGIPGAYLIQDDGSVQFRSGRFWVQELALKSVCEYYLSAR
jgi:glutathione synthase/RimK-type ligase-like ATP-grasp enzyme